MTTNQIRITLALQGQQQVSAGLKQTAQDTAGVGDAAAGISSELKSVAAQIRAMGEAAAIATQHLQRQTLDSRGLSTTADSAGQALRRQQDQTTTLGNASERAGQQVSTLDTAVRGVVAGIGVAGLVQLGQRVFTVGTEFDALRNRIDRVSASSEQGGARFGFVTREADRLGLAVRETADNYADFIAGTQNSGLGNGARDNIFSALNEAGAAYELTQAQINQNFDQLIRIGGRAKVTMDDLAGALGTNLPQTMDALALGLGVSTRELQQLIADGRIAGNEVLPALADGFRQTFGTDAQTQISGAAAKVQELKNELLLLADESSGPLTRIAGNFSDYIAQLLRYEREGGAGATVQTFFAPLVDTAIAGANALTGGNLRGIGSLARSTNAARDFVEANPFRPALYNPNAGPAERFFGPGRPAVDGLVGARLLGYGVTPADPRAALAEQRKADAEHAAALREQERITAALTRDAEQALQADLRREETLRERVADVRIEAELIAEQLRTGKAMTGAARELFVLQRQAADPATGQLRTELAKLAALEQQVQLQKEGERLAREATAARERADRQAESYLRRREPGFESRAGERDPDPISRLDAVRASLRGREEQEFQRQMRLELSAREAERAAGTDDYAAFAEREEALAQAHADRLLEIDRQYAVARIAVFTSIADATATVLDQLGQLAQNFGAKGFAAYKAFAIAETLISTYSSAQKSYESLASIPVVGPVLGGIAAATAVANGLAQVGRIRGLQPAGRRFGGAVTAGQMVELNEGGISEVYRDARSGRQYFIPGNSGEVTPARAMSGSGGAAPGAAALVDRRPLIQVFEQTGTVAVRAQARRLNRQDVVEIFVEEIADNASPVGRGVQNRTGRRAAGGIG
ncbi:tape measure protein [Nevskia sp.]|uniref:tape measure protein n=1 Tax=Nevskia sp. TaxID=1929292 RepID=UPI003F70BE6F